MDDHPEQMTPKKAILPAPDDFPSPMLPMVYSDGVSTFQPGPEVVKFYLSRLEPHLRAEASSLTQPVVQVAMSVTGFLQMVAFFNKVTANMLERGVVSPQQVEAAKSGVGGGDRKRGQAQKSTAKSWILSWKLSDRLVRKREASDVG
jgi:hypothetical protein